MVILVAEISGGVWAYMNRAELHKMVRETVQNTVHKEYTKDNVTTTTFDMIQQSLRCCGSRDYKSWLGSVYHPGGLGRLDIGVSSQTQNITHVVPESCCVNPGTPECKKARQDVKPEHNPDVIHAEVKKTNKTINCAGLKSSKELSTPTGRFLLFFNEKLEKIELEKRNLSKFDLKKAKMLSIFDFQVKFSQLLDQE